MLCLRGDVPCGAGALSSDSRFRQGLVSPCWRAQNGDLPPGSFSPKELPADRLRGRGEGSPQLDDQTGKQLSCPSPSHRAPAWSFLSGQEAAGGSASSSHGMTPAWGILPSWSRFLAWEVLATHTPRARI
ncbi:UNVERIFIED_CONTAM: hypothetical protein K2H54_037876 [Gekko kuhli]